MKNKKVCIVGGTGFVGHHIIALLCQQVKSIRVLTRRKQDHKDLLVIPNLELVEVDIHQKNILREQFQGMDVVINLVGILNEGVRKGDDFRRVHVELTQQILDACAHNHVSRLLHMSALNADASSGTSMYLRTKGEGENMVHTFTSSGLQVTSFRPSIIFGPGDSFFNRFAAMLRILPWLPLACPNARMAPVYVGDVAQAFINAINDKSTVTRRIELCGPRDYSLLELVQYVKKQINSKKPVIPLPDGLSKLMANIMQFFPGKPFTPDNYNSLQKGSICSAQSRHCTTSVESIVPLYIGQKDREHQLQQYRSIARR